MHRLGAVSFLNAKPLIDGLDQRPDVELVLDVPSKLPALLDSGAVDAALVPIIDVIRSEGRYAVISDACIGCDGETMTVRIFSQVPPDRITRLRADTDSHTSVALARVIFGELYDRALIIEPFDARRESLDESQAVLLIGDKVVDSGRSGYAYEMDLGGAWRAHTGLPFVFAVWARRSEELRVKSSELAGDVDDPSSLLTLHSELATLLSTARNRGVENASRIAETMGPPLGWTAEQARRYLTRCLTFTIDARAVEGADLFAQHCAALGLANSSEINWPEQLCPNATAAEMPATGN